LARACWDNTTSARDPRVGPRVFCVARWGTWCLEVSLSRWFLSRSERRAQRVSCCTCWNRLSVTHGTRHVRVCVIVLQWRKRAGWPWAASQTYSSAVVPSPHLLICGDNACDRSKHVAVRVHCDWLGCKPLQLDSLARIRPQYVDRAGCLCASCAQARQECTAASRST
jgi:hypothetical protein